MPKGKNTISEMENSLSVLKDWAEFMKLIKGQQKWAKLNHK